MKNQDKHVLAYHQLMCLPEAQTKHRRSLAHWVDGNKPLVRSESACFIGSLNDNDFVILSPPEEDQAVPEAALDWALKTFPRLSALVCDISTKKCRPFITNHNCALRSIYTAIIQSGTYKSTNDIVQSVTSASLILTMQG